MGHRLTADDFWKRVAFDKPSACALYAGPGEITKSGHVRISFRGKKTFAHRLALELARGPIPPGKFACHRCVGTPACCSPAHLYTGDALSNAQDRDALRRRIPPTGLAHWSSRLDARAVRELREARTMGVSVRTLVEEYRISRSSLYSLWAGRTYTDVVAA
jgi:hypothetical protein